MQPDDRHTLEVTTHSAGKQKPHEPYEPYAAASEPVPAGTRSDDLLSAKPNVINLLYMLSFFTFFTGIAGVVLCYIWSNDPAVQPWEKTHLRYQIRTFWFGLLGMVIGTIALFIVIGFLIWAAVAVWMVIRCIMSFNKAQYAEPMPDPSTLLW